MHWALEIVDLTLFHCVAQLLPGKGSNTLCCNFLSGSQQGMELLGHLWGSCHRATSFRLLNWIHLVPACPCQAVDVTCGVTLVSS